jgi:L-ribulose-5-phosphate 3-epimerase
LYVIAAVKEYHQKLNSCSRLGDIKPKQVASPSASFMFSRRRMLQQTALSAAALIAFPEIFAASKNKKIRIGACDWSLGKDSDVTVFELAKQIGLEGVMINMGGPKNNFHLRQPSVQQQYLAASQKTGVKISSIAIAELNNIPYKSAPETEEWVWDSVEVAKNLGVSVVLLAFFEKNDLRNDEAGKKEVINRLKKVAPHAYYPGY